MFQLDKEKKMLFISMLASANMVCATKTKRLYFLPYASNLLIGCFALSTLKP